MESQRRLGRLAAAIDEGARFQQQHWYATELDPGGVGLPLAAPIVGAMTAGQFIHHRKTDVMAGAVVLAAGIADAEQDAHGVGWKRLERRAPARRGWSGEGKSLFAEAEQARHFRVKTKPVQAGGGPPAPILALPVQVVTDNSQLP